jgi:hypothetical protein
VGIARLVLRAGQLRGANAVYINNRFGESRNREVLMTYMLCRNRVANFARWRDIFASHAGAHRDAGLRLVGTWRSVEDPNNVFFMFEVASMDKALEFISHPEAAKAGYAAGVVDGEYHFLEDASGY